MAYQAKWHRRGEQIPILGLGPYLIHTVRAEVTQIFYDIVQQQELRSCWIELWMHAAEYNNSRVYRPLLLLSSQNQVLKIWNTILACRWVDYNIYLDGVNLGGANLACRRKLVLLCLNKNYFSIPSGLDLNGLATLILIISAFSAKTARTIQFSVIPNINTK